MLHWEPNVVSAGDGRGAAEVDAAPCPGFERGLEEGSLRLHRVGATPERQYCQDFGRLAGHVLVGAHLRVGVALGDVVLVVVVADARRASGAIEHLDGVLDEVWPEADWALARLSRGAHDLHDRPDRPLRHAVELVHVRGACRARDRLRVQVLGELVRQELAGVVHVQLAHYPNRLRLAYARERVELGHEGSDSFDRFGLVLEEVYLLEARVVVDEHEKVKEAVLRTLERTGEVTVDESADVRRLVRLPRVWHSRGVGRLARVAVVSLALLDGDGDVGCEVCQPA